MTIVSQQTILIKYDALLIIVEQLTKFEMIVYCKLKVALYGLKLFACSVILHVFLPSAD